MSDRGLPTEGAPACPFVAFEDDRDGRATAPDHRHRCFAEPRPATRALAHQEAYCLSSAFPVCPTFQDWARREAAAARPAAAQAETRDEAPPIVPLPPVELEPRPASSSATPPAVQPRRNPPRDWAAPPPWTGDGPPDGDPADAPPYAPAYEPFDPPAPDPDPGGWGSDSRGLAGSAADRLAGPDPNEPAGARPAGDTDEDFDAWAAEAAVAGASAARGSSTADMPPPRRATGSRRDARRQAGSAGGHQDRRPQSQAPSELFGPAWEGPRRYEAYPSLRTRIGLPSMGGIPRLGIYALGLALAALLLFFFGPMILGLGKDDLGAGGPSGAPAASAEATATPLPTEPPAPTPQVYVVVTGDIISKIAKRNGLTLEELLAANPQIKNPNKIKPGDEITIPIPIEDGAVVDSPTP